MSDAKKQKTGGAKLARTQTITVRLDEKLRYLAELAARKQRRTLSSFVEWAIQDSLERAVLKPATAGEPARTVASESTQLWDVDEAARFVKVATEYPELLTHEEQLRQQLLIRELIWDFPHHQDTPEPQDDAAFELARRTAVRERIEMVRPLWKLISKMSEEDLLKGYLPPQAPPASVIAEAVKKDYMEKSAAADRLRLLQAHRDPEAGKNL